MGKRTGFLLATIHQGSSTAMWKAVAEEANKKKDSSLFVFPGGRLGYADSNEYLRNQIYSLANNENLDNAIVWSSSLTGKLDYNEVSEFVKNLNANLPVVSLGLSIEGIPSVDFNAYSGIFSEVDHLIRVHGCKKIAFVRGPESHRSAESRFQAYKDALDIHGIPFDKKLVSSPSSWSGGINAIKELVETRGLKPGEDFDAIVFASDLLMFWASKYLDSIGVNIPGQIKIAGFNDSDENALMSVASTTVKMPIRALAATAYALSDEMGFDENPAAINIVLPADMIIRSSCGCQDSFGGEENASKAISSWDSLDKWLRLRLDNPKCADILFEMLVNLYGENARAFIDDTQMISSMLNEYFACGGNSRLILESIKWIELFLTRKRLSSDDRDLLFARIIYQQSRYNAQKEFNSRRLNTQVDAFKLELLATSNYSLLIRKLKEYLPSIGISKAFICTYKDDTSIFQGGFSSDIIYQGGEEFSSHLFIAPLYSDELNEGVFVIEPLIHDNTAIGYIILKTIYSEGKLLEDIRTSVSATIKCISLFSIASEKSYKAEEAEKKSAEFYARLSEGLKEPLEKIRSLVDAPSIDRDLLVANVTQAAHLVELSLAEKGEINLDIEFIPLQELLKLIFDKGIAISSANELPSINMDSRRMADVFEILSEEIKKAGDDPHLNLRLESTCVSFVLFGEKKLWNPAIVEKNTSILLAEKIILMHGGSFGFSSRSINLSLPFPSLEGEVKTNRTLGPVLFISDKGENIPDSLLSLSPLVVSQDELLSDFAIPPNCVAIAMDASAEKKPSTILINLLKNHVAAKSLSFMLFGVGPSISLITALEGSLPRSDRATIFSFGSLPDTLSKLKEFGTVVQVSSLKDAEISDGNGSLAIFYDISIESLNKFRSSRKFNKTPILIVKDSFDRKEVDSIVEIPNVLIVNSSITESEEFISRIVGIFAGSELLPSLTSALVKRAIAYLNKNASLQISRWQLAEAVNISEDYLTRIFRKEVGISPWDYLNRYRIQLACKLLLQTGLSINEIAQDTGFQDQAYFCRVFKKVKGFPPGHIRQRV